MVDTEFFMTDKRVHFRQADPSLFQEDSFKTIRLAPGVSARIAQPVGLASFSCQSISFDLERFDSDKASYWLEKNKSKFARAIALEEEKASLFQDDTYERHMNGHLPALSSVQLHRLMQLAGPAELSDEELARQKITNYVSEKRF